MHLRDPQGLEFEPIRGRLYHSIYPIVSVTGCRVIRESLWIFLDTQWAPQYRLVVERVAVNRGAPRVRLSTGSLTLEALRNGSVEEIQARDLPLYVWMQTKYPAWDRLFGKERADGNPIAAGV